MGTSKQAIQINAEIKASLSGMDKVVSDLEDGLKKQKYDLSKNSGLAKLIKQYKNAKSDFDSLTELDKVGLGDVDKTTKAAQKVADIYKQLGQSFRKIQAGNIDTFKNLFPDNFSAKIEKGNKAINQYFKKLEEKSTKESRAQILEKDIERLNTTLSTLENKRIKAEVEIDISKAQERLKKLQEERKKFLEDFSKSITPKEVKDSSGKIYDKANIQTQIEAAEKEIKDKEKKVKNLEKRKISQQELDEIERLKEGYEGVDFKRQQKAAQDALKKYRDEASARDLAQNEGIVDKGRSRRTFGNLTDEELEGRIRDKQQELIKLEKKEKQYKDKIAEIKTRPEQEFKQQKKQADAEVSTAKTKLENANKELETYQELKAVQEEVIKQKTADFESGKDNTGVRQEDIDKLKQYDDAIQETTRSLKELNEEKTYSNQSEKDDATSKKKSEIDKKKLELQTLQNSIKELTEATNIDEVFKKLEELNLPLKDIERSGEGLQKLKKELKELDSNTTEAIRQSLKQIGFTAEETEDIIKQLDNGLDKLNLEKVDITKTNQDMENLKNQIFDFFSIGNTIQIFKTSIKKAIDTVKELDAVMTETAVVTDFSIGDMWEKLPEYTEEANKLGTSISSLYQATTLYYQQGLQSNEAMGVGVETMKMARIANMDAADATTAMTAALRGFNMEINETSATRVNDVYSELAAITAADTSQIATAMGKTASIAASANMEFETTAALLAQIIETTQEAPETAGTAMKTIIARFTEVKKLKEKGLFSGEDSEGELIDVNKIQAALRTVDISMDDFFAGTQGLDSILLELASKWNTLDFETQHYIATMAAGSRQQSRFLAMMSNYDRTMELVNAANDSAGASQEQFNKTLDSLEAKLQELQNAWQQFTMGLANSDAIKWVVDVLTDILNVANRFTDFGNSGASGFMTFLSRVLTIVVGLKSGRAALKGLGKIFINPESQFGKSFLGEFFTGSENSFKSLSEVLGTLPKKFTKITEGAKAGKTAITLFGKALPIGAVAGWRAVIIAAAGILGFLIKKAHDAQTSVKLEKVNKEIKKLDASIVETKNEIEEISSAKSGLVDLNETFAGLTKGTDEWRAALIEINSQVVSLLEKYPDLKSKIGENGQLTIIEESWQKVLSSQQQAIENITATKIAYQNQALDLEEDLLLEKARENILKDSSLAALTMETRRTPTRAKARQELYTQTGDMYGSLSEKEYLSLLRYFSEHSVRLDPEYIDIDLAEVFREVGIIPGDEHYQFKRDQFKDILTNAGEEFYADVAKAAEISSSREQQNISFVGNALASNELAGGKEYTDAIANTIASQLPEEAEYNDKILEAMAEVSTDEKEVADQYARIFGYQAIGGEVYKDATMSEKVDSSLEAMRYAIAANNVKNDVANTGKQIAESTAIKTSAEIYDELMGGQDGSDITASTLTMFEGKSDRQIAELLGYKSTGQQSAEAKMTEELGEGIFDEINSNLQKADERIKKQREATAQSFTSAGRVTDSEEIKSIEDRFADQLSDVEVRTALDNAINSLKQSGDQSIIQSGLNQLLALGKAGTAEDFAHMSEIISDVDWNSPIQAASQIQTYMKSADDATRQFGEKITALGPKIISASAQMEELFISAEYSDIEAEIKELVETHGELSGADVEALGEKYQKLGQFIENTQISVEGLGHAFELINNGAISTDQLTNSVLASLNTFQSLDTVISGILGKISEFDPGLDENDIPQLVNTAYETISGNISKGAYGNSQNDAYLDFLLGPNWDKGEDGKTLKGDAYAKRMEQAVAELGKNRENLGNSWRNLAQGKNFWGEEIDTTITEDGYTKLDGSSLMLKQNADGSVDLEGFEGMTTEELVSELADAYGTSEEYAEMMLGDFANYSTELKQELDLNDYEKGFEQAYEKLNTLGKAGKRTMDSSEADAIDKLYGLESGTTRNRMEKEKGVHFTNFYDENGELRSTGELVRQINNLSDGKNFAQDFAKGSALDYDSMMAELEQLNLPESARQNIANSLAQSFNDGAIDGVKKVEHTFSDGITRTIDVKAGQTIEQAIAQMEQEIQNKNLGEVVSKGVEEGVKNALTNMEVGLNEDSVAEVSTQLDTLAKSKTIDFDINLLKKNIAVGNDNGTITFSLSAYKKGLDSAGRSHDALVSEEGPELIQTKDGAYLSGLNGPEIVRINRGDTVYTAEETRRILQTQQHSFIPRHARGYDYGPGSGSSGGRMSSNSSESGEKTWENPFDKLYNLVREIDEELRQRERIERRYEQLLTSLNSSANEIIKVSREELTQLEKERALQEELIAGRKWQIDQYQSENKDLQNYAQVTQNERGEDILRIDWDAIEAVTDPDQGQKIEDYVSQLEEWFDELESAEEALWDIEDAVSEIKERGKDEYFDLEELIKDAIVSERQKEIDELSKINESINETNNQLMASIQKTIDQQRQDRDNARTEEELSEKQRRLLYLQQDTSGANDIEILKLQKEIDQEQEDYTDSLIDQKISALQEQNDKAAEQRETQISIMQAQLDNYVETGDIWNDVYSLMNSGLSKIDGLVQGSALQSLLQNSVGFEGMSELAKMKWLEETNQKIDQAISYLELGRQLEDLGIKENTKISFTSADGKKMTGVVDKSGNVVASDGKTYSNVFQGADGKYYAGTETVEPPKEPPKKEVEKAPQVEKKTNPYGLASEKNSSTRSIQWALNEMGYNAGAIDGIYGWQTTAAVKRFQQAEKIAVDGIVGSQTREKFKLRGYNKGGLADFTGPAWLDGTKARPEVVLDAQDSRNFIQLRDILGSLLNRSVTNTSTENNGDITYDIDINVESVGNDYDIEQIAGKIKSLINEDARYRNNNAISLQR